MVIPLTPHQNYLRKIGTTPPSPSSRAWRPFKASTQSMDVPLFIKAKSGWNDQKNHRPRGPCHPLPASSSCFIFLLIITSTFDFTCGLPNSSLVVSLESDPAIHATKISTNIDNQPGTTLVPKKLHLAVEGHSLWHKKVTGRGKKFGNPTYYIKWKHDDIGNDKRPRFQKFYRLSTPPNMFFHLARTYTLHIHVPICIIIIYHTHQSILPRFLWLGGPKI